VPLDFNFDRELRPASAQRLFSVSDGDTPNILQPVRMVSIDTPEKKHYAGRAEVAQPKLDACRQRLLDGLNPLVPDRLRLYLIERLDAGAATRHIAAGEEAAVQFDLLLKDRLARPDGSQRRVATIPTGEVIDRYGRMLAYLAPWFSGGRADPIPAKDDPARRTFNLEMVAAGWAAPFMVFPSLPQNSDLNLLYDESKVTWTSKRGAWKVHGRSCCWATSFGSASSSAPRRVLRRGWNPPSSESVSTCAARRRSACSAGTRARLPTGCGYGRTMPWKHRPRSILPYDR
jgi:endonuclease YncB( thermonuclease family)